MPQSLANVLVHLVFSTKDRHPYLSDDIREESNSYVSGILNNLHCPLLQIGGVEDHVHILFQLSRTLSLAQVVQDVKTGSSKWMKSKGNVYRDFAWQSGYGAFSVSSCDAEHTIRYIQNQKEHHGKVSFQDELRALLREAGMEFDERYLWD